jgi:transcriptional regulator with XRE-family HTH domain
MKNEDNVKSFAKLLQNARVKSNVPQKDMADHLGIPPNTLSDYENGKSRFPGALLPAYAEKCGLSVDELLGMNKDESSNFDPDVRMIARARSKMPAIEREKMMQILKLTYEQYFNEGTNDDGTGKQS